MIEVLIDETFEGARMTVDSSGPRPIAAPRISQPAVEEPDDLEAESEALEPEENEEEAEAGDVQAEGERHGRRRRRRRRGGRGRGRREGGEPMDEDETVPLQAADEQVASEAGADEPATSDDQPREGGRRRRRRGRGGSAAAAEDSEVAIAPDSSPMVEHAVNDEPAIAETQPSEEVQPAAPKRRTRKKVAEAEIAIVEPAPPEAAPAETADESAQEEKPARKRRPRKAKPGDADPAPTSSPDLIAVPAANNDTADEASGEPRRGWWQRTFG